MSSPKITRRDLTAAGLGLAFGTGFGTFADFARAETTPGDDHFMIFLELRGGVHWITATAATSTRCRSPIRAGASRSRSPISRSRSPSTRRSSATTTPGRAA